MPARERYVCLVGLPGGAGEEGGDDVGGVAVEGHATAVVAHGGAGVRMAGCLLDVSERDAGVEGGGDERVAEGVGPYVLVDPRSACEAADDPGGSVAVETLPVGAEEDRPFASFADGE